MNEFNRMCQSFKWKKGEKKKPYQDLEKAMVKQFNSLYGTNVDDIGSWRKLCQVLEIFPIPEELEACRKVSSLSAFPV